MAVRMFDLRPRKMVLREAFMTNESEGRARAPSKLVSFSETIRRISPWNVDVIKLVACSVAWHGLEEKLRDSDVSPIFREVLSVRGIAAETGEQ